MTNFSAAAVVEAMLTNERQAHNRPKPANVALDTCFMCVVYYVCFGGLDKGYPASLELIFEIVF